MDEGRSLAEFIEQPLLECCALAPAYGAQGRIALSDGLVGMRNPRGAQWNHDAAKDGLP